MPYGVAFQVHSAMLRSLHTNDQRWPQPSRSRSTRKITIYGWSTRSC